MATSGAGGGDDNQDIGWQYGSRIGRSRQNIECRFCRRELSGGITRLKQHLAHQKGNVAGCPQVPREIMLLMRRNLENIKVNKAMREKQKKATLDACREEVFGPNEESGESEDDRELEMARRESLQTAQEDEIRRQSFSRSYSVREVGGSSGGFGSKSKSGGIFKGLQRAFSSRRTDDSGHSAHRQTSATHIDVEEEFEPQAPIGDQQLFRKASTKQKKLKQIWSKNVIDNLGKAAAKLFLHNSIPPNVAASPYFQVFIDAAAEAGTGIKAPTPYQIDEKYSNEVYQETLDYVQGFRKIWATRGCTIMCDGWTGPTRLSMINFMVYCHLGTVFIKAIDASDQVKNASYIFSLMDKMVDEIGESNVVQIVTDNEASYKAAGRMLMEKRNHLFWSPCAAHCIDLILEDIGKRKNVASIVEKARMITTFIYNHNWVIALMKKFTNGRELLRPGATRFATNFISLESLYTFRGSLSEMISSRQWIESKYGKLTSGPSIEMCKIIRDNAYWRKVLEIIKVMEPLIKVLKLVESDERPTMGFIYEAMDRAKLSIQANCKHYKDYWKLIDRRWDDQLHHELHAAAQWWVNYGESAPHLKKIAIRILSQTTSSASCERNWSTFALIHTKQRNRMKQQKVERNVFIHYNVRLRLRNMKRAKGQAEQEPYCPINLDNIFAEPEDDPLLPWLEQREKDKEVANSEEENYPELARSTTRSHPEIIIEDEDEDGSSSATRSDHRSESTDSGDDDNDSGRHEIGGEVGGTSETIVPNTYPQSEQSQHMSRDRGKSPLIQTQEEEDDYDEEEQEEESPRGMQTQSPWPTISYPHEYWRCYEQLPPQPPPPPPGASSYDYLFDYPPEYRSRYGQDNYNDNNNRDDNDEEPARHSFWW